MDFQQMLQPVPRHAYFEMDDWYVWGASMVRDDEGVCHLFFSRWPKSRGFDAWVTHSEIAHAAAADPLGPYEFQDVALPARPGYWDADVTHNPTALKIGARYYLYYMGNSGRGLWTKSPFDQKVLIDDEWWYHRNQQRIGVAVADHPRGPWRRLDKPVVGINPDSWDCLIASNPAVTVAPDGRVLMVYKTVSQGEMPFGGNVYHAAAFANDPLGPFTKHSEPILTSDSVKFPTEDPYLWWQDGRYWVIAKDMNGYFTGAGMSLALFESSNGTDWQPAAKPLASTLQIDWADGPATVVHRLERPQLWLENGRPRVLFCAVHWGEEYPHKLSGNVHIPLS